MESKKAEESFAFIPFIFESLKASNFEAGGALPAAVSLIVSVLGPERETSSPGHGVSIVRVQHGIVYQGPRLCK
jgi:hypothetical protein